MDDHYAINAAKTELREGYKNGDVERILAIFADSFTDMRMGQASFYGSDSKTILRARLEKLFREHDVELIPIICEIVISGDIAIEYGWHRLELRPKASGRMDVKRTRYAEVWRCGTDRVWQIVYFIDNADEEPELVEHALRALSGASGVQKFAQD